MDRTEQSRTCTDAPQVTPPLRPIDYRGHTPAPLTDADVDHALGAYGPAAPYQPRDRIGQPAAWRAFGDGPDGGNAA